MIELNEAPHKLTNHNKMMMSKSYSVDSICNQDGGGVDKRVVLESRENQTTIVPPTSNSRFSSYKSAAALMRPGANTKSKSGKQQSQTKSVISNEQPRTNKLNKLKKQQASSASNYEISSLLVAGVRNSEPAFLNRTSIYSSRTNGEGEERAPPLSLMQKLLLDEQKIYSDPSDNYKRRTVVLVRPKSGASNAYLNRSISNGSVALNGVSAGGSSGGEFGFNLQAYGFLNKLTQQTEYICFVRNVESNSPASRAGLQSGDVLLAIDGVCLSEFRSFAEITQHVRGKNELRLVLMAENISKRIQCQLKAEQIRRILVEKRAQLDKVNAQAEDIMRKYGMQWPPSSLLSASSPMNASTTSASVTESGNNSSSSSSSSESSKCSGDGLSLTNSTSSSISASTAMSLSNTTPLQPPSHIPNTVCVITAPTPTSECSAVNSTEIQAHDLSSTKEDASGRLTINESTIFMSPPSSSMLSATNLLINQSLISSSDVTSDQEVVSSSLSQSSSFSSSAVPHNSTSNNCSINRPVTTSTNSNSVTTNGDNKPVIMNAMMMKSSTPVDPSLVVTSTAISTQKTAHKSNHLDKTPSSIMSDINNNNLINKPNKSSNGGLFKSSQPSVNNNPPTNKPSFARKYIESTSRLVRSASSSSMNLFSSLKSSLSSSNLNKVSVNHQIDGGSSEKERKRAINYSPSFSLPKQSQVDEMVSAPITAQPRHSISTNTDVETASMSSSASSAQAANVLGHPQRTNSLIEQLMNSRNKSTSSSSSSSSNNKLLKKHYLQQLANGGSNNNQMDSYQRQHYSFSKEKASNRTEDQTNTDDQQSSSRLSTQYSSDRPIVKLNNHYNTPNPAVVNDACSTSSCSSASSSTTVSSNPSQATNGKQQAKYHRNDFKNIFSLLSNKPKISSRMNRYRLDTTALTTTTTTTTTTTEQMATSVKQRPLGEQHLGRSMSCDFNALAAANTADTETETESESSPRQSVEQPEYSTIPVIDYTHDDYVITRL